MGESIIVESMEYCMICGAPGAEEHHALFGSRRKFADRDGLIVPLCHSCHMYLHQQEEVAMQYRQLAEEAWILERMERGAAREEAIKAFIERYGKNYLEA